VRYRSRIGPKVVAILTACAIAGALFWLRRERGRALSPAELADANRAVAGLQQIADEHHEALEIEAPAARDARLRQLLLLLDQVIALVSDSQAADRLQSIRRRLLTFDHDIGDDCRAAARRIAERARLRRTPLVAPDLAEGKRLYAKACAACHGEDGTGRGVAVALEPPPPDILHPQYNFTPHEVFNRVTYGGIETGMPAFAEGLTEDERWSIVFHLFAARWPPCKKPLPPITSDELALSGDFELGNKFGYGAAACLRRNYQGPPR
jgi:mono/diheme cytochrome c family protein